jgi:hypothetical protein
LLAIRDALIAENVEEAYNQLYWLADRGRSSLTPWDEWEAAASPTSERPAEIVEPELSEREAFEKYAESEGLMTKRYEGKVFSISIHVREPELLDYIEAQAEELANALRHLKACEECGKPSGVYTRCKDCFDAEYAREIVSVPAQGEKMIWRVRFDVKGGHVHCELFVAKRRENIFAKCGSFVVQRGEEFSDLLRTMTNTEFIGVEGGSGIMAACNDVSRAVDE